MGCQWGKGPLIVPFEPPEQDTDSTIIVIVVYTLLEVIVLVCFLLVDRS